MRYVLAVLCALALGAAQFLYGGAMRPVFALPAFALVGLAGVLALSCYSKKAIFSPHTACLFIVAIFAGWLIWCEQRSSDVWLAADYLRLTLACLATYLLFACILTNPYHRMAFLCGVLLLAFIQAALAFWQVTHRHEGFPLPWLSEQLRVWYSPRFNGQAHGLFLNKNQLAWFLNTSGFFALSMACWGRWKITARILCLYVALMSFAVVVLSASRGGILGTAGGLLTFFILSVIALAVGARQQRMASFVALAVGVLLLLGTMAVAFQSSYVVQGRFSQLLSDSYRSTTLSSALRQAQLDPLTGTGPGTFLYYGRQFREHLSPSDDVYAHNDWVQLAGDFGFPAIALLLLLVLLHATNGWSGFLNILLEKRRSYERPQSHVLALTMGGLSCLAVFSTHSLFDFNMQIPANALLAAAVLGMLGSFLPAGTAAQERSERSRAGWIFGYAMLGASACWLLVAAYGAAWTGYFTLRAENALLRGDWKTSLDFVQKGEKGQRTPPALYAISGEAFLLKGKDLDDASDRLMNYEAAVTSLSGAVKEAPMDWSYRIKLARALWRLGKLRQAEREVLEAIRLSPFQGQAHDLYVSILEGRNNLPAAANYCLILRNFPGGYPWQKRYEEIQKRIDLQMKNAKPENYTQ